MKASFEKNNNKWDFSTICAQELSELISGNPHILPLHASSAFAFERVEEAIDIFKGQKEGYVYTRFGNPTIDAVAYKLALLENFDTDHDAFCVMCSSGMAAVTVLTLSLLKEGDEMITQGDLYGGTTELFKKVLSRNGIRVHFTDLRDQEGVDKLIRDNPRTKLLYFETPTNPILSCIDIENMTDLCKRHDIYSAIDNTFATPYLQRPFNYGVDFIIHSTTKFLNGHGNSIAGCIIGKDKAHRESIWETMKLSGSNCNPWDAWLLHNGLKTLPLRMDKQCSNAMKLARYLEEHPRVIKVNYPGLESSEYHKIASDYMDQYGAMLSFELDGGVDDALKFMNSTNLCTISPTLGNVDTLLLHPMTSSHLKVPDSIREQFGITPGLVRVSTGIEDSKDIINDVEEALNSL